MDWATDQPTELQLKLLKLETKLARLFSTSALKYDGWHSESFSHLYPHRVNYQLLPERVTDRWRDMKSILLIQSHGERRPPAALPPPCFLLLWCNIFWSTYCFHAAVWLKRKNLSTGSDACHYLQGCLSALKVEVQEHQITVTINCVIDSSPVTVQETACWRFFNFG